MGPSYVNAIKIFTSEKFGFCTCKVKNMSININQAKEDARVISNKIRD